MSVRSRYRSGIAQWSISYYDLVLLVLPVILMSGFVVSTMGSVPMNVGIMLAGLASAITIADALFNRPPTGRSV
ncbi:hypothetical protein ACFFQF_10690 [Haladaptatus pallidirubidus]|uniref:Uncharacterized protein n=1 Tax=Haladaptatus pallidirubidus TaxID=1008152 RepID=A0AAV3UET1_9EURY|nr:hypothetical protein [Haladaptatus pallidirubidus]